MALVRFFGSMGGMDAWMNPFSIFGAAGAMAAAGGDAWLASDTTAFADTYIHSRETPDAYVFQATLPAGVTKEEVRVDVEEQLQGNVLVIAGERSVRREARTDTRHHIQRTSATFFGRFHLPDDAAVDRVRAALDDAGALTVTVPRVGAAAAVMMKPADDDEAKLDIEATSSPC